MKQLDFRKYGNAGHSGKLIAPLLSFLGGEHAGKLAQLWPAPHEGFLVLPTARRHAAAMLVSSLGDRHALSTDSLIRLVERQKDRVIAELLVGPNYAQGFMKALAKLGEVLWDEADYRLLIQLYCQPEANLYLRHLEEIRPVMLRTVSILPVCLRQSRFLQFVRSKAAARDIRTAYDLLAIIRSPEAQEKAAKRWLSAKKRSQLYGMIGQDLEADRPMRWSPPPVLPAYFQRVETVRMLKARALEFQNCLADFVSEFSTGRMAIYIWHGQPKAAVALIWNVDGWRLAEAEAADNTELDESPLGEIVDILEAKGVRIGPSIATLRNRMYNYGNELQIIPEAENEEPSLKTRCELGDLWN